MGETVSLTPEQLTRNRAKELLLLLRAITADGFLADEEIILLNEWLIKAKGSGLPGARYLRKQVHDVLQDHRVSDKERFHLLHDIIRVLPEEYRDKTRLCIGRELVRENDAIMQNLRRCKGKHCATALQHELMQMLHLDVEEDCTYEEANALIAKHFVMPLVEKMSLGETVRPPGDHTSQGHGSH